MIKDLVESIKSTVFGSMVGEKTETIEINLEIDLLVKVFQQIWSFQ